MNKYSNAVLVQVDDAYDLNEDMAEDLSRMNSSKHIVVAETGGSMSVFMNGHFFPLEKLITLSTQDK